MRLVESVIALGLILSVLPLLVLAVAGLVMSGRRPLIAPRRSTAASLLMFNVGEDRFGVFLRSFSIDKLAALFGVISGKTRLGDAVAWTRKPL